MKNEVKNQSCTDLGKTDAQIIVEAIIEKQIKYVEGQYVQGLNITEIESEQKKSIWTTARFFRMVVG